MVKILVTNKTYTPKKDETLGGIVKKECPDLTWKELALYNWATDEPAEVNRALFEIVGCRKIDWGDPDESVLDPNLGTTKDILIPKVWTGEAEIEKLNTIKVKSKTPSPAVAIPSLDKWFIPRTESCEIQYKLEGLAKYADKLALEVHGSNYCKASAWNDGLGTFAAVANTPVYKRAAGKIPASERSSGTIGDWKGEADVGAGLLKGAKRLLNVAFSPYTVMFRYYKDEGDKDARLLVKPFWPRFDVTTPATPVVVAASLKIEWEISGITRLKNGTLLVVDRDNRVVYRRALPEGKLAEGSQFIDDWDGAHNWNHNDDCSAAPKAGKVTIDRMPYRVQIQAHTGVGDVKGVALAAMHTEVRLYVDPKTKYAAEENYDPALSEPQSFAFALADFIPDTKPEVPKPAAGASADVKRKYAQFQLAKAGYHPGPVDGIDRPAFQTSMKEFKRSRPKRRAGGAGDFERLTPVDASIGAGELDALEDLPAAYLPWFAAAADGWWLFGSSKLDALSNDSALEVLQDPAKLINVWVDDRQYYDKTKGPVDATVDNDPAALGNQRGTMDIGDGKTAKDAACIPRPWIPLQLSLPLLGRGYNLDDELSARRQRNSLQPDAIGPIRVDWAFDEAGPDVSVIPDDYKHADFVDKIRSKKFVSWTLTDRKETNYERKDLKRKVDYTNCPEANGGLRDAGAADYYHRAFGVEADSFSPWRAGKDAAHDSVVTVAHADWGGDVQTKDQLFTKVLGAAGVYFHPSNIAGDGYRVRARVRFTDGGGFTFANHAALEARYPKVPQANTAKMRLWRKTWLRGYIRWTHTNTGNWPKLAGSAGIRKYYDAAHVHVVHAEDTAQSWKVGDLVDFSDKNDVDKVKKIIAATVKQDFLKNEAKMTIDPEYLWPWVKAPCLGWEEAVPAAVADNQIGDLFLDPDIFNVWRAFRLRLIFELLKRVEKKHGRMKGHLLVEFDDAPKLWVASYVCNVCAQPFRFLERTEKGGDATGFACPNPAGCSGRVTMEALGPAVDYTGRYVCDKCHVERDKEGDDNTGAKFGGTKCNRGWFWKCDGNLSPVQAYIEEYECAKCAISVSRDEPNSNGGAHVGDACPDSACQGVIKRQNGSWERYVCPTPACPTQVMPVGVVGHPSAVCPVCGQPLARRAVPGPDLVAGKLGKLTIGTPPPKPTKRSGPITSFDGFSVPAVGAVSGATWLFTSGETVVWGHEMGHHRHLEHAANAAETPAGTRGANSNQHDFRNNPAILVGNALTERQWDLHCMMNGYPGTGVHPVREHDFPCGKCILKNRGWSVQGLALPAAGVKD